MADWKRIEKVIGQYGNYHAYLGPFHWQVSGHGKLCEFNGLGFEFWFDGKTGKFIAGCFRPYVKWKWRHKLPYIYRNK